jgi:hypothetical protein
MYEFPRGTSLSSRRASPQMYAVAVSPSELAQLFQALKTKHNA